MHWAKNKLRAILLSGPMNRRVLVFEYVVFFSAKPKSWNSSSIKECFTIFSLVAILFDKVGPLLAILVH